MKKYFLTVDTFRSSTKLGELVAEYIKERYQNSIVTATQLLRIPNEIEDYMYGLTSTNKRLKPMTTSVYGFLRGIADSINQISDNVQIWIWSSVSADNDNRPFTIHATKIRVDLTDSQKGGNK